MGAGQIARGDNKKRKSIVFPLHSPRERKKTSKAQAAVSHRETQGIWFELAEGTPPPVSHTPPARAPSSPRKPAQPQPSSPRSGFPPSTARSAANHWGPSPQGRQPGQEAPGSGGQFCTPSGGRSWEWAEPETADRSSTFPSG